ncbi:MAG: diguanylate cyclase [Pseudomonas sp.]|uniref:sensor domain-containing diguanylate cyclase n=1 Tax=Pseudomonas sp. TaxID=306 RepID=UPI002732EC59|nr:diguanylate cyclase [Pseudomonas sp.]MDP3848808.1 diguanylate cyclase [Pseudomonas sp.]
MRLNSKIALILVVPMLILIGAFAWAIHSQVLGRFAVLERAQQEQNHQRLLEAINNELDTLSRIGIDYSGWDDTYQFMQDHNPDYIAANLTPGTLINLQIDGILLFDRHQQLQTQLNLDSTSNKPTQPSSELLQRIAANLASLPADARQQGILTVQGRALALVSSPITDSNGELPPLGTLVMFRYLDRGVIDNLAKRTKLNLHFSLLQGPGSATIAPEVLAALARQPLWLQSDDPDTASSYSLFNDLIGTPALLIQVSMPRDIYHEGLATARQLLSFTFVALLAFVSATFLAIHRTALKRLTRLSRGLATIGNNSASHKRLETQGNDEISQVARAVNVMLDDLDLAFEQRRSASERQRELNALLVRIATDDSVLHGDTTALFAIMAGSLTTGASLDAWSLWLAAHDGQSFDCLRASADAAIGMTSEQLSNALTQRESGLPNLLQCQFASPQHHGLILPFHVDSHLAALCVEAHDPQALCEPDERDFLLAATRLIERALCTHFQNLREQDLRQRAEIDGLTGLANRSMFEIALMQHLAQVRGDAGMVGLLFIDLDHFKAVNDTHGHAAGDWLLCQVAERLRAQVRADDLVARLGGDEFTIILSNLHSGADAERIAEKILQALSHPFLYQETPLRTGASIGLAWAPEHGSSVAELVKAADLAMYKAKQHGRGNWTQAQSGSA